MVNRAELNGYVVEGNSVTRKWWKGMVSRKGTRKDRFCQEDRNGRSKPIYKKESNAG